MSFNVNNRSLKFSNKYSPELEILGHMHYVSGIEQKEIVRLYFTEGIPSIFIGNPIMYEKIRSFLGNKFNVNSKAISMTGSGRIGYSLSPNPAKFGRTFINRVSDIDLFVIDSGMFNAVCEDFILFDRWLNNNTKLDEKTLTRYQANRQTIINAINRGFIDQNKIPDDKQFKKVSEIYLYLRELLNIMGNSKKCPQPRDASVRIYNDWNSCINQITLNISTAIAKNLSSINLKI